MNKKDMVVICIVPSLSLRNGRAGTQRLLHIMSMIADEGVQNCVLTKYSATDDGCRYAVYNGVQIRAMLSDTETGWLAFPKYIWRIFRYVRQLKCTKLVYYCFGRDHPILLWYWLLSRLTSGILVFELNEFPNSVYMARSGLRRLIEHMLLKVYDGGIIMTQNLVDYYAANCRRGFKSILVPMTVDYSRFGNEKRGNPFAFDYIAYTGAMRRPGHGVDMIVKAFSQIEHIYPELHLVLIGNGTDSFKQELMCFVQPSVQSRVHCIFGGVVPSDEMPMYIKNAKVLLTLPLETKQQEGCFPTKLGEYMASGRPVVLSKVGNPALCLTDGEQVRFVRPNDVEDTVRVLREVLDRYDEAEIVAARGKQYAKERFDYRTYSKMLVEWLTGLC